MGASVGDVKWAPYSSTVLAALTTDGKVFVFDINVNKYKPICIQQVVPKRTVRLTRIAFNQKIPFIVVGDDKLSSLAQQYNTFSLHSKIFIFYFSWNRGNITTLKLSPNLRLKVKPPKKLQHIEQSVLQVQKLDKLLSLVRELPEDLIVEDVASSVSEA